MRFIYQSRESLPRLAWAAIIEKGSGDIQIYHGPWIETNDNFFVGGVWDGEFKGGAFEESYAFMGSGGKITDRGAVFCTPCHTLERIFLFRTSSKIFLSPSIVFLLSITGRDLKPSYNYYLRDLHNIIRKISNNVGIIPIKNGDVSVIHYRNVTIDSNLGISISHKNRSGEFSDFNSYKKFLTDTLTSVFLNAGSSSRRIKYTSICAMSSGYDSTACTAIAKDAGCREVVTHRLSVEDQKVYGGTDDCGTDVAKAFGLDVKERNPRDYLKYDTLPEAEFVASGYDDEALPMSVFANDFIQKVVISGINGDAIWNRIPKSEVIDDFYRPDGCCCSITEFSYKTGFIHIPLPFIGGINYKSIHRITLSEEMKPYIIGGEYDRPIPRRIVEEKGVDRLLFGQKKTGLLPGHLGSNIINLQKRMSKKSFSSFEEYYRRHRNERFFINNFIALCLFGLYRVYAATLNKFPVLKALKKAPVFSRLEQYRHSPLRRSFLFCWGVSVIRSRYKV